MLFQSKTRKIASKELQKVLRDYPGLLKEVLMPSRFDKWVEKLTVRTNQLALEGFVANEFVAKEFIKKATCIYADTVLSKLQGTNENYSSQKGMTAEVINHKKLKEEFKKKGY